MKNIHKIDLIQKYEKHTEETVGMHILDNFIKGIFNYCPVQGYIAREERIPLLFTDISVICTQRRVFL